jgi:hypothetical protein
MQPSPPDQAPSPDELRRVRAGVERIGRALSYAAQPGWIRLDLRARVTVDQDEMTVAAVRPDGSIPSGPPSPDARGAVLDLRRQMYAPSRGAWLSVRITVEPPNQLQLNVNYNDDPLWSRPVPGSAYRRDLQAFPRPPHLVSGWLRSKLDEPA